MEGIGKIAETGGKFTGSEYLHYGDLRGLAKSLGVSPPTVYGVYQGQRGNARIEMAIKNLIEIRKTQLKEVVIQYANDN